MRSSAIGLMGRDYDAPVAILSTLVLGIGARAPTPSEARGDAVHRDESE